MTTAREIMTDAAKKIAARAEEARQVDALYKFILKGDDGGTWMVDLTQTPGVEEKDAPAPCTLTMSTGDFVAMMEGNEPPQVLFFSGKLQIEGDVMLALRLQALRQLLA